MSQEGKPEVENSMGELFEIRIQGQLHQRWSERFAGMTICHESDGTTTFSGSLPDQTALHGILLQIRNMNLKLISVNRVMEGNLAHDIHQTLRPTSIKAAFQRFHDLVRNKGNLTVWDELIAPTYVEHLYPFGDLDFHSAKAYTEKMCTAFSDREVTLKNIYVDGDTVVMHWKTQGTHTGQIFGISPTGKKVEISGCSIIRLQGCKAEEAYIFEDWLGFFQQLGVVPVFEDETA